MSNRDRESRLRRTAKDNVFSHVFQYIFRKQHLTSRTRFKELKRSKSSMVTMRGVGLAAEEEEQEGVDALETVLMRMGEMGTYQWIMFAVMAPFAFMFAFVYFGQMFLVPTPQVHWCRVPELAGLEPALRRQLTAPPDPQAPGRFERCRMFVADYAALKASKVPPQPGTPTQPCEHGWDFMFDDIPYSTITNERGWVCEAAGNVPMAQALFFVGAFLGGIIFGYLADSVGRIPALVGANMMAFVGGVATVFTTQFWDFCLARVAVGMAHDNCFMLLYILVLEYVGPKHRTFVANVSMAVFFGGGCVTLPWIALAIGHWPTFVWLSTVPMLMVLAIPVIIPESARWLSSRGHLNRTIKVLDKVAWVNRRQVSRKLMDKFIAEFAETHQEESILTMLRSRLLRHMLLMMVACYMATMVVFDALVRLSENLGLDFFLTFSLSSATEIPSTLLVAFLLDRGGRRILTCIPLFVTAVLALIAMFMPKGIWMASLALLARFTVSMSYSAVTQWCTEVLPTSVRGSGSAGIHVSGYLASILSPYIVFSERVWASLPFLILALLALLGGLVGLLLPETVGLPLPQSMTDGEILVEEYSYYGRLTKKTQVGVQYIKPRLSGTEEAPVINKPSGSDDDKEAAPSSMKKEREPKTNERTLTIKDDKHDDAAGPGGSSNKPPDQQESTNKPPDPQESSNKPPDPQESTNKPPDPQESTNKRPD